MECLGIQYWNVTKPGNICLKQQKKTDFTGKLFAFVQLQVYNRAGVKDM